MHEKISEKNIREEKIKRLKEKILNEIEKELVLCKKSLKYDLTSEIEDDLKYTIFTMYYLYKLQEFINWEHSFNQVYAEHYNQDKIIYIVPIREIDIWLQEKYNFVRQFLFNIENEEEVVVETMLKDNYFGIHFTSIFDRIAYDEKKR